MIQKFGEAGPTTLIEPFGLGGIVLGLHAVNGDVWACVVV
jgi:hypothetical protein